MWAASVVKPTEIGHQHRHVGVLVGDVDFALSHPLRDGAGENIEEQVFGPRLFGLELVEEVFGVDGVVDAQGEFLQIDRFAQEIAGPGRDAHHALHPLGERGDNQDRDVGRAGVFLKPPADFEAVHAGHHHVQQDDVGRPLFDFLQGLLAVLGFDNFIAVRLQRIAQQCAVCFIVVHDQHETAAAQGARRRRIYYESWFQLAYWQAGVWFR